MATIKMTKVQKFNALLSLLSDSSITVRVGTDADGNAIELPFGKADAQEFIAHEVELLSKKNAAKGSKPAKTDPMMEQMCSDTLEFMEQGERYRANDVFKGVPSINAINIQKATAVLTKLVKAGLVTMVKEKGVSLYEVVGE